MKRILKNQNIYKYLEQLGDAPGDEGQIEINEEQENMEIQGNESETAFDGSPADGLATEAPGRESGNTLEFDGHVEKKRRTNGHDSKASTNNNPSDMKEMLLTIITKVDCTNKKVDKMNVNLDMALQKINENRKDIDKLKEKEQHNDFELKGMKDRVSELEKENKRMKDQFIDLAAREMRCTAVFFGFPEGCEKGNCEGLIQSFAETHLDLQGQDLRIERAHRSGQRSERGAPRPIMVAFNRYTTRSSILASARKLLKDKPFVYERKENPIFVDEMLPKEIRDQRKKLSHTRQKLKTEHGKAYFKYPARLFYRDKNTQKEVEYKKV